MPWSQPLKAREQIAAEKREAIVKEAARAFNRRGYHGTSLDEIAGALGITKPALYYYVKDKEDLLLACHQLSIDLANEGIERAKAQATGAAERLRIALEYLIEGLTDELGGTVMLLEKGALSPAKERALIKKRDAYEGELRSMIERGVAAGEFAPCDAKVAVFTILGSVNWVSRWYSPGGRYGPAEVARMMAAQLVRGLLASPPAEALAAGAGGA